VDGPGRLLASGRDADIFEYGPRLVLRRSRASRSVASEAHLMEYLRRQGYPVPAVEEVRNDDRDLVMERVDGPTMLEALRRAPWTVRRQAAVLADLHQRLHALVAPDFLRAAPVGQGTAIVHLDLHPLNVIVSPTGPVVIDWTNAAVGDAAVDVGVAWVLMAAGEIPQRGAMARVAGWGRGLLVEGFIGRFDRDAVAAELRAAVTWKTADAHLSAAEIATMWRTVEAAEARLGAEGRGPAPAQ
jgi:aminoglycoside phosphotransferase (APT) family kinase protein